MTWLVIVFAALGGPMFAVFGALAMVAYRSGGMDFSILIGELTTITRSLQDIAIDRVEPAGDAR